MKRTSYPDRDYDFGQTMLTLRTRIGLTQAGLAAMLGVSRRAVGDWEAGSSYPQTDHLKQFIELAIHHEAFPAGHVAEEVHSIYEGAHQKMIFDEHWLARLLPVSELSADLPANRETSRAAIATRLDWDAALAVPSFYGREWELNLLTRWVVAEGCRVLSVLGLGGIGKSTLAITLMHRLAEHFDVVIWRSLRDFPTCKGLLDDCLRILAPQSIDGAAFSNDRRPNILLEQMRGTRVLLVLDNLEAVLEEGDGAGRIHPRFENFGRFLQLAAETGHRSCVILTSREKPAILAPMEGNQAAVRAFRLTRLDADSCERLLAEKGIQGSRANRARLIEVYTGNPLALKIVAQTIVDLFDGEIAPFLEQGEVIFGGVRDLLGEQFSRLSRLEQNLLLWLAILREPTTLDELLEVLVTPVSRAELLEGLEGLSRHSLIEPGLKQGSFALQPVVLEYLTAWLISQGTAEIHDNALDRLIEHSLDLAPAWEYIRQTQERFLIEPILAQLKRIFSESTVLERHLLGLLAELASLPVDQQGYGPANLVSLLRVLRGDL